MKARAVLVGCSRSYLFYLLQEVHVRLIGDSRPPHRFPQHFGEYRVAAARQTSPGGIMAAENVLGAQEPLLCASKRASRSIGPWRRFSTTSPRWATSQSGRPIPYRYARTHPAYRSRVIDSPPPSSPLAAASKHPTREPLMKLTDGIRIEP